MVGDLTACLVAGLTLLCSAPRSISAASRCRRLHSFEVLPHSIIFCRRNLPISNPLGPLGYSAPNRLYCVLVFSNSGCGPGMMTQGKQILHLFLYRCQNVRDLQQHAIFFSDGTEWNNFDVNPNEPNEYRHNTKCDRFGSSFACRHGVN